MKKNHKVLFALGLLEWYLHRLEHLEKFPVASLRMCSWLSTPPSSCSTCLLAGDEPASLGSFSLLFWEKPKGKHLDWRALWDAVTVDWWPSIKWQSIAVWWPVQPTASPWETNCFELLRATLFFCQSCLFNGPENEHETSLFSEQNS